jgi:hypothetical protein
MDKDMPITINLAINDFDPDSSIDASSVQVIQPDDGTVRKNLNGTLMYSLLPNFNSADSFVYTVADTAGARVTVCHRRFLSSLMLVVDQLTAMMTFVLQPLTQAADRPVNAARSASLSVVLNNDNMALVFSSA